MACGDVGSFLYRSSAFNDPLLWIVPGTRSIPWSILRVSCQHCLRFMALLHTNSNICCIISELHFIQSYASLGWTEIRWQRFTFKEVCYRKMPTWESMREQQMTDSVFRLGICETCCSVQLRIMTTNLLLRRQKNSLKNLCLRIRGKMDSFHKILRWKMAAFQNFYTGISENSRRVEASESARLWPVHTCNICCEFQCLFSALFSTDANNSIVMNALRMSALIWTSMTPSLHNSIRSVTPVRRRKLRLKCT